jgi:hypothetical protein
LNQVPQTASGFVKGLKALKKSTSDQYKYLKNIPLKTLEGYYKKNEIQNEELAMIL